MSARVRVRIRCSVCGVLGPPCRNAGGARNGARARGWRLLAGGVDLCPAHSGLTLAEIQILQGNEW